MTAFVARRLTGVIPPVCTPLTSDLEVDVRSLERLVEFLIHGGVDGLFVLGSSGESAFLPDFHRRRVLETVASYVAGEVPLLVGVIDTATLRVVEHAERAGKIGCDGIVATAPFYTRTHPAEIERHFRLIAESTGLPVYAYDLPVSVHSKLENSMLLRLAAEGVVAGVKDSSGDEAGLRRLLVDRRDAGIDNLSVLTGSELTVDNALRMGADGVVPGLGNVDPDGYARLYKLCSGGDWDAAVAEQERLLRLMDIVNAGSPDRMGRGSSAVGAFKAALHLRGVIACPVAAPPQIPLDEGEIGYVYQRLSTAGLL